MSEIAANGSRNGAAGAHGDFLAWWVEELRGLLPAGATRGAGAFVVLAPEGAHLHVHCNRRGRAEPLATLDLARPDGELARALGRAMRRAGAARHRAVLRLPAEQALRRQVELPRAAEGALTAVMAHQVDKLTPWPAGKCRFDCEVVGVREQGQRIEVRLTAVARADLERQVARLRALGVTPAVVDVAGDAPGDPPRINLLPPEARVRRGGGRGWRVAAALLVAGFLGAIAYENWLIYQKRGALAETRARIETARLEAEVVARLGEEVEALREESAFLVERKRQVPATAVLLEVLSRLLPDGVWLQELTLDGDALRLVGFAPNASELIGLIERSPHFSGVAFGSPIIRDDRYDAERFDITARVRALLELGS